MSAYTDRLRQIAQEEGMNVDEVMRVVRSEGGLTDPFIRSRGVQNGVQEYSLGPLQLNMRRGVGVEAKKAGYDASKDWEGAYRFGLQWAKKHGWGDWEGAKKLGLVKASSTGKGGGQYDLRSASAPAGDVGGLGRGSIMAAQQAGEGGGDTVAANPPSPVGAPPPLPDAAKPKTWNEKLAGSFKDFGDAFANIPGYKPLNMPGAEWMGGGAAMPSVYRPQLMPTSVGGGMGGGGDMRQLLAMLMQGGGGRV